MIEKDLHAHGYGQPPRSKNRIDTATEVRLRITETLASRTKPRGSRAATIEDKLKHAGDRMWSLMKKRPLVGVAMAGGTGLVLATAVGVGEITFALVIAYGAYQVLREGVPPAAAEADIIKVLSRD